MFDADGRLRYRCGFRIGGGIDQDPSVSPQGYPDKVLQYTVDICSIMYSVLTCWLKTNCVGVHCHEKLKLCINL